MCDAVALYGGSRARECTVGDADWSATLSEALGREVWASNYGHSNRTFDEDRETLTCLPDGALVLIGVDEGRFAKPLNSPRTLPPAVPSPPRQHHYDDRATLDLARKRQLVAGWLDRGFPRFRKNCIANALSLVKLVTACEALGLHPALMASPLNSAIVEGAFDDALDVWVGICRKLSAEHSMPFIDLRKSCDLAACDFYDLFHLTEPGYVKWQAALSSEVAAILRQP